MEQKVKVLYDALTITQNSIHRILDLDQSRLSDTWSGRKCPYLSYTDTEYQIGAPLVNNWNYTEQDNKIK